MIKITLHRVLGERRMSRYDLSKATGIRNPTICDLYADMVDRINLDHLDLICEALHCEISDILVREENDPPRIVIGKDGKPHPRDAD